MISSSLRRSGATVYGVNDGAAEMSVSTSSGGGGRFSTGFSSKVTGAIVMSSSIMASVTTGVAGRAMASGGGGISISGGMSIISISSMLMLTSGGSPKLTKAKKTKWKAVPRSSSPRTSSRTSP